ncbi:PilN domain-containing protein [Garciella nitratireducens]|uniref:PilN domain-containing protein n=1 Tax=Garciella nitratireducens TaxID=218205 RepID=UPI000DE9B3D4|nr:PilN domain-containing protein [Garciella nitratireducens]RBP46672.1 Tfp pilus assembly protein PilN [Garciella nitratireducens]
MREMNLLPEEDLYKKYQNKKRKKFMSIVMIFAFLLLFIYFIFVLINLNIEKKVSNINSDIQKLGKVEERRLKISSYQKVITDHKNLLKKLNDKKMDHFVFLEELEKTLPNEVILNNIFFTENNVFHIEGKTTNPNKIADFMVNLSKINGVKNVFLQNINYSLEDNNDKINFPSFYITFTYSYGEKKDNDFDQ